MNKQNISIIGLPEAGKTTYIAALWALMIHDSEFCSMTVNSLKEGNQEYINKISEDWASYLDLGRTKFANVGDVVMDLKNKHTNEVLILNIPDFHGELFDAHFQDREWTNEYYELMLDSDSFILFVDPYAKNNISRTIMNEIEDMEQFVDIGLNLPINDLDENQNHENVNFGTLEKPIENTEVYKAINTSNQVKLVEILQYIQYTLEPKKAFKIAIIVSKWDNVIEHFPNAIPNEILKRQLPLLYQFLECNYQVFEYKTFGISAQGIDYNNKEKMDESINKTLEDRVVVFDGQILSKDIAKPIMWLTE